MTVTTRFATPGDAAALVVLRAAMFTAMGQDVDGAGWRAAAEDWFATHLPGDDVLVAVADEPVRVRMGRLGVGSGLAAHGGLVREGMTVLQRSARAGAVR